MNFWEINVDCREIYDENFNEEAHIDIFIVFNLEYKLQMFGVKRDTITFDAIECLRKEEIYRALLVVKTLARLREH